MKATKQDPTGTARVFLLSSEGAISVFTDALHARGVMADGDLPFDSPTELRRVTDRWSNSRLVSLFNSIPGVIAVKKFTDRSTGLKRIWEAIQTLEPVRQPDAAAPGEVDARNPRPGTKKAILLALLAQPEGASVREIMAALGWQSHSVRGCLSSLSKQQGTDIHSFRRPDGERAYSTGPSPTSDREAAQ